ncbi:phosphorylase b kinase regulatory subunit beta-like isoform X2 [Tubulanus polymorphus]|uniref:phosphorylase b kinase regulatory subunit beta-like isoform X2 n=1 Tax=Tubulanus polymorphus TaxID=672921 RepID=UPI003DA4CBDF
MDRPRNRIDVLLDAEGLDFKYRCQSLEDYYKLVRKNLLEYQSPTTGLFPQTNSPEECKVAHIRDSLYCAAAIWSLSLSYRKVDNDKGRTFELAQCTIKCMRGILMAWMKQSEKVERFKQNQSPKNALHCKFDMVTGDALSKDDEGEHLQIDAVALFILFLVEMIESSLQIIFTTDEVNFIQNLVFYLERAYRTPDYGMWERGNKYNNGSVELHASSIGMAKAALESINGFNVFGSVGAAWSVIYVDVDAHNRNRTIFETLLPRESASKNTDASLIPVLSWPAFALHEKKLRNRTLDKLKRKLNGKYSLKRFLRDGYKTVLEDKNRKYYRPAEIKTFDGIECEWPLFDVFLLIESCYFGSSADMDHYQNKVKSLLQKTNDGFVLPKYYYVPKESIEAEKANPGSQERLPSQDGLFLWGQALFIISQLLYNQLLYIGEVDPIRRFLPAGNRPRPNVRYSCFQSAAQDMSVQIVLIAESVRLQQLLGTYGIQTQTPHQVEPVKIWSPNTLMKVFEFMGINRKLGLTGRPRRPIGQLGTSKFYRIYNTTVLCYPLLFELNDFYLSQDMPLVIDELKSDLAFLSKQWKLSGRPTFCMLIREDSIRGPQWREFIDLLAEMKRGSVGGIKVRVGRLQNMISSACMEHLDFFTGHIGANSQFQPVVEIEAGLNYKSLVDIPSILNYEEENAVVDQQKQLFLAYSQKLRTDTVLSELEHKPTWDLIATWHSADTFYLQSIILHLLMKREGSKFWFEDATVEEHINMLARKAGIHQHWSVVRFCSSLLNKIVDSLAPSLSAILVRGRQVTLGVFGQEEEVVDKPLSPSDVKSILYSKVFPHDIYQAVMQQEMILYIGRLFAVCPELFEGILKVRVGWIVQAMKLELRFSGEDESDIYALSPSGLKQLLHSVLTKLDLDLDYRSPLWRRQLDGALNRVPKDFYDKVWLILERTPGGIKVAGYHLPQQPTLSDMTLYELNFMLLVEQMLSKIADPAYRQIVVETFMVVATILDRNQEVEFSKTVDVDKMIREAFDQFQRDRSTQTGNEKEDNMNTFFNTRPNAQGGTTSYIAKAVVNALLEGEVLMTSGDMVCCIS